MGASGPAAQNQVASARHGHVERAAAQWHVLVSYFY
jgi:hypothetical protein